MSVIAPVQDAVGRMERRFFTASFIPVTIFVVALAGSVVTATGNTKEVVFRIDGLSASSKVAVGFIFLLVRVPAGISRAL